MMNETTRKDTFHTRGWQAIVSITMIVAGCACYILGCVSAMIITNRHQ